MKTNQTNKHKTDRLKSNTKKALNMVARCRPGACTHFVQLFMLLSTPLLLSFALGWVKVRIRKQRIVREAFLIVFRSQCKTISTKQGADMCVRECLIDIVIC